jgi:hypothetical protein
MDIPNDSIEPKIDGSSSRREILTDLAQLLAVGIAGALLGSIDDARHGGPQTNSHRSRRKRGSNADYSERSQIERFLIPNTIGTGFMFWLACEIRAGVQKITSMNAKEKEISDV